MSPVSNARSVDEWLIFSDSAPGGVGLKGGNHLVDSLIAHLRVGWRVTSVSWDEINLHHAGGHVLIKKEAVRTFKRRPAAD